MAGAADICSGAGSELTLGNVQRCTLELSTGLHTGDRPKGAGGAAAPPRKNNSACRNENRAIVSTVMKILSEQKLEVC